MTETLGNKFRETRELKGLSVEDVARSMKLKPERVRDLEADIYTNFASIAYAKGFVLNYGKFLGVDVKPHMGMFDCSHNIGLDGFQYLAASSSQPTDSMRPLPRVREKKGTPIGRVLAGLGSAALVIVLVVGGFLYLRVQQLGFFNDSTGNDPSTASVSTENPSESEMPTDPPDSDPPSEAAAEGADDPVASVSPDDLLRDAAKEGSAGEAPSLVNWQELALRDRALLQGDEVSAPPIEAAPDSETVIVIRPKKRTFVRVVSGDPDSEPLFQSVLEPGADPVEFSGQRFLIESTEDQALEIFRNGQAVAQPSGRVVIE